jgi:L-ascorbate metabolism protein UlaG (beta-lactamase superfamily)
MKQSGQALLREIDALPLPKGGVAFWWLGQMSYVVKVGQFVLYLDPFLAPGAFRNVPPLMAPEDVHHADYVLCSHDHGDHVDSYAIPRLVTASPQARFVSSKVAAVHVAQLGVPDARRVELDEGMVYEADGLRITPIAAAHEFLDRDPVLGYPYLSYIIEADGVTLYHSGDTCVYEGMLTKLSRWSFDVMFVPINGRDAERYRRNCIGNMTFQEAVDLVGTLKPRLAVPGHYDMFKGNTADPALFADYMDAKYPGVKYWIGEHGETVVLPPRA